MRTNIQKILKTLRFKDVIIYGLGWPFMVLGAVFYVSIQLMEHGYDAASNYLESRW